MKQIFLIFAGLLLVSKIFSQNDTIEKHGFWARPYVENGITFPNNSILTDSYSTNSIYNWGVGLRIGNPNKMRILPFFQYSKSSFTVQKVNVYGTKMDSTLTIEEYIAGFNVIVKRINSNNITAKVGYIDSSINDECVDNSGKAKGLQLGIGYEMKIFRNSRLYINYSYDFLKLSDAAFRDYDIQKITFGFML